MRHLLTIALTLFLSIQSSFAIEESNISSFMQTNIDRATTILRDKAIQKEEKAQKLYVIFDSIFDYTLMAKLAVGGKAWDGAPKAKQTEFSKLFEKKLKNSYMEKLDLYTDEKIVIKNLEKIKETRIHLSTHLMRNGEVYEIVYKFYKTNNNDWLIYDVDVIGVSIIQSYRTQFADILAKESFDNLVERLKKEG